MAILCYGYAMLYIIVRDSSRHVSIIQVISYCRRPTRFPAVKPLYSAITQLVDRRHIHLNKSDQENRPIDSSFAY